MNSRINITSSSNASLQSMAQDGSKAIEAFVKIANTAGDTAMRPIRNILPSSMFSQVNCSFSQSILKKLEQLITNIPSALVTANAISGVAVMCIFGLEAVVLAGLGVAASLVGGLCQLALRQDNLTTTPQNMQAKALLTTGIVASSLMFIAPFNWIGFSFGLGQGVLWSSIAMGIGSKIKVT